MWIYTCNSSCRGVLRGQVVCMSSCWLCPSSGYTDPPAGTELVVCLCGSFVYAKPPVYMIVQ